jgi:hypothetical protein
MIIILRTVLKLMRFDFCIVAGWIKIVLYYVSCRLIIIYSYLPLPAQAEKVHELVTLTCIFRLAKFSDSWKGRHDTISTG